MKKFKVAIAFIVASFVGVHSGCAIISPKSVDYSQSFVLPIYSNKEIMSLNMDKLKEYAEAIPCCTMNEKGTQNADPINIILVAGLDEMIETFKLAGWDQTETLGFQTGLHMFQTFIRRRPYRYSPVSKLYFKDKEHDLAFQKINKSMNYRLHLRLWFTPLRVGTTPVWVGQVSRDIGVKFVPRWNFLTHRLEASVDEARGNLLGDLSEVHRVKNNLYVEGVGEAGIANPKYNLHDDSYYTDGKRLVLVLGST